MSNKHQFMTTGTIAPLSSSSDNEWEIAISDPVLVTSVTCSALILVVVFAAVVCLTNSSRRSLAHRLSMDAESFQGQRKADTLSMNTLRAKGVAGHGVGCVVGQDVTDLILSSDAKTFSDGQSVCPTFQSIA